MRILLDGKPHTEIELAQGAGFTKVAAIQRWLKSFENARFISRVPAEKSGEGRYQIVLTRDAIRKIYYYPEFRKIRPLIRTAPWFGPLSADTFAALPGDLHLVIQDMIKRSHSFFEIIDTYDTPEKVREIYRPCLYVNELQGLHQEEFNTWCLYYQLYVQCIVRDLSGGGLAEGFMDLVRDIQVKLRDLHRVNQQPGGIHHGDS